MTAEYRGWSVDLDKNLLCDPQGRCQHLPAKKAEIVYLLVEKQGKVALESWLIDRLWGVQAPNNVRNLLHAHICKLRKSLPETFRIQTVRSRGYWLDVGGTDASAQGAPRMQKMQSSTVS